MLSKAISTLFALACFFLTNAHAFGQDVMTEWNHISPLPPPDLKPITIAPAATALVMMDFDRKSCNAARRVRCFAALPKIEALLKRARENGIRVVHFYNANMALDDIVPQLAPSGKETAQKVSGDKFFGTDLGATLRGVGVTTVILAGTSANGAVLATALGAF